MAGNVNYDNLLTLTLESRTGKLADNVTESNALLKRLKDRGNIRPISGGSKIVEEIEYGEGDSYWYTGFDTLTYTGKQLFTAAEYEMKLIAAPVGISGEDLLKNSGRERVIDLMEAKIKNAEKTLMNQMSTGIYSDGTGSSGKQLTGLRALVADDPTSGTVGGINRATTGNEFWRNYAKVASSLDAASIYGAMNEAYLACSRGSDKPDLIVADDSLYKIYESSLIKEQRFVNAKMADAGFENLKFKGADVIYDGDKCPQGHMYFLNTDYIKLRPHKDRNFKLIGDKERMAINQDAIYRIIGWAGNLTMSNAKLQGVLAVTGTSGSSD